MQLTTLSDLDLKRRRVLLRADYNVKLAGEHVVDDLRLRASVPTIEELRRHQARVVICTHRGRPRSERVPSLSTAPIVPDLEHVLGAPVRSVGTCVGPEAEAAAAALRPGELLLLENVRFDPGEEADDPDFAAGLARLADVFVNDAFGTLHRAHAPTVGVPRHLPSAAGLLVEREVERLGRVLERPELPLVLVAGGVKVAEKLPLLRQSHGSARGSRTSSRRASAGPWLPLRRWSAFECRQGIADRRERCASRWWLP